MTTTAGQVAVKLNIDKSQFEAGMNSAKKSVDLLSVALGSLASVGAGAMLLNIGKQALKASSDFEQANVQFGVMLGSAEKASKLVNELQNMANVTPFETQDLLDASKTLLNFGTNLEEILPDLQMLGDISGGNRERMRSMTLAFSQMSSAGRLMGQDLLQMINAGFNPLQVISEKTGKSMAELKDEMGEGKISVEMVKQAFKDATSEGGRFYGMMDKQSETLEGRFSTLNDAYTLMIRSISDGALPVIKQEVIEVTKLVEKTTENIAAFKEWAAINNQTVTTITNTGLAMATVVTSSIALAKIIPAIKTAYAGATAAIAAEAEAKIAVTQATYILTEAETALNAAILEHNIALTSGNAQEIASTQAKLTSAQASYYAATANSKQAVAISASTKATSLQYLAVGNLSKAFKVAALEVKAFTTALLANPLTWVTIAIAGVAGAVMSYKNNVEQATAAIKDFNNAQNQSIDETENAIRTLQQLNGVLHPTDKQYRELQNAIETLKNKYPAYASEIQNEIRLQGKLSETLARKIALMETEQQLKKLDAEIDKNSNFRKGFHPVSNFKYAISFGKMDEYKLADDNVVKLMQEREKVISRYEAKVQTLMNIGNDQNTGSKSTSTASTDKKKKKKTDKQLAAEAKAAAKEALEYKLALLDVERYKTERTDAEIYKYELKKADLKIAAAKKGTSEYAQALAEKLQLERDYEKSLKDLQSSKVVDDLTYNKQEIDNKLAIIQLEYDAHKISKTQMLQTEIQFINQKKQLEMAALEEQLKLVKGNAAEEVKIKRASQKTMEDYNLEANRKALELWEHQHEAFKNVTSDISSGWGSTISDLLNGNLTFEGALNELVSTVLDSFGNMCGTMVQNWVADHLTMETVTKLFGIQKVATDQMINASNAGVIASNTAVTASNITTAASEGTLSATGAILATTNTAVAVSAGAAATTQAAAAGTMVTASGTMSAGASALLAPTMKLSAAMAALALSSGASAANMSLIALSTGLFTLEATVASLTTLMLNVSLGVLSATSQLAAKGMANLAVANAANSAAMIPFVGWMMAPGAAMATGLSIAAGSAMVQFREKGGEVKKGQPYIVGEKRPELFIPDRNGRIEPNLNSLAGGGDGGASSTVYNTPVTISVQANDAASFASKIDELTDRIHSNLEKKIKRRQLAPLGGKA
nr:MAG TPA: tail tape measure protein [Caudoviricetes sp.]